MFIVIRLLNSIIYEITVDATSRTMCKDQIFFHLLAETVRMSSGGLRKALHGPVVPAQTRQKPQRSHQRLLQREPIVLQDILEPT